jgi:hypothetical protein
MMERVVNLLDTNHVTDYQINEKVIARSRTGAPRFDNPVWPGYNVNITMQFNDDNSATAIIEILRDFNKTISSSGDELITVCSWKMDNYIID